MDQQLELLIRFLAFFFEDLFPRRIVCICSSAIGAAVIGVNNINGPATNRRVCQCRWVQLEGRGQDVSVGVSMVRRISRTYTLSTSR